MSWYDIPDLPEDKIFGYCDCCCEIYGGEDIYEIDGGTIHGDCLPDYARENPAVKKEACLIWLRA